jgi:hypothetical protein
MPGSPASDIANIDPANPIYIGSDQAAGPIKFAGRGTEVSCAMTLWLCRQKKNHDANARYQQNSIGYDTFQSSTQSYVSIGPAATLALGLTECCARHGRGKAS